MNGRAGRLAALADDEREAAGKQRERRRFGHRMGGNGGLDVGRVTHLPSAERPAPDQSQAAAAAVAVKSGSSAKRSLVAGVKSRIEIAAKVVGMAAAQAAAMRAIQ